MQRYILLSLSMALVILTNTFACKNIKDSFLKQDPQGGIDKNIIVNFSGKASLAGWDLGVLRSAVKRMAPIRTNQAILTGNSSGSLLAAFFSCYGMSAEAVEEVIKRMNTLDRSQIPESVWPKATKLIFNGRAEIEPSYFRTYIQNNLKLPDGTPCTPKFPLIISAVNGDILDVRTPSVSVLNIFGGPDIERGNGLKIQEPGTYRIFDRSLRYVGKACTYFANDQALAILNMIPESMRQCDVRLIRTYQDMVFAVLASIAEPTYFYPVREIDANNPALFNTNVFYNAVTDPYWLKISLAKSYQADLSRTMQLMPQFNPRLYIGGYLVVNPAQDLRRVYPDLFVFSTGHRRFSTSANLCLQSWYLVRPESSHALNRWWMDLEVQPTTENWTEMDSAEITNARFYELGQAAAERCFTRRDCVPKDVATPAPPLMRTINGQPILRGRPIPQNFLN